MNWPISEMSKLSLTCWAGVLLSVACGPESVLPSSNPPASVSGGSSAPTPITPAAPSGQAGSGSSVAPPVTTPGVTAGVGGSAPSEFPNNPPSTGAGAAKIPCDVSNVVAAKCQSCHGASPVGGAPMPLVTRADFAAMIKSLKTLPGETQPVSKLVKMRINDQAQPMPPGSLLPETDRKLLSNWIDQNMPAAATSDGACGAQTPTTPTVEDVPLLPDGSRCYKFMNHGQPMAGDASPYAVPVGEHYVSFYYNAPWKEASELVRWRTLYDNRKTLHHWLLYTTLGNTMDGTFLVSIGTHIGDAAQLVAGWAVGGNDTTLPPDVGLRLPAPGAGLLLEWHFYNTDPAPTTDQSGVEICTVPAGTMKNTAGMTWLGTENFNGPAGMPPKSPSTFAGTCFPSRAGMDATSPIHIFTLWPHMHKFGRNMKSVINRANGTQEEVFNKPFDFNYQITYPAGLDLFPGDAITSTCDFENTSNNSVAFGPSTDQEMCYQFAFSYPAGALDNGVPSLVGASNTCW